MPVPPKIWLYRITHLNNLKHILQYGFVTSQSPNANPHFVEIGDNTLIKYRKDLDAPDPPGGKLSDYIPFYLGPRSPMLYQIATGFEGIRQFHQENIIYLITSLDSIKAHDLTYFFTDGHARSLTSSKYTDDKDFELLDWKTIYDTFWKNDDTDLRRKEKKQAELLIKDHLPLSCVEHICVFNEAAKQNVLNLLQIANIEIQVRVSPQKLYYDHL
jgi:hypothetical protein